MQQPREHRARGGRGFDVGFRHLPVATSASLTPPIQEDDEGRDQDRPDEERVEQDAQAQGEAELSEGGQAAGEHRAERAGHDQAARADDPAGVGDRPPGPLDRPVLLLLLDDAGHQEDVVVLADGHQDHEQEEADLPVEPAPGARARVERLEDQLGHAERREVAEHDRDDQVEADPRAAEQEDEDDVDAEGHQEVHPPLVAAG